MKEYIYIYMDIDIFIFGKFYYLVLVDVRYEERETRNEKELMVVTRKILCRRVKKG